MEDRETARMRKYGESKTTRIMMAAVPHVTSGLELRKFQADGFLLTRVYKVSYNFYTCGVAVFIESCLSLYSLIYIQMRLIRWCAIHMASHINGESFIACICISA